ncbi:MAG: sugar phosphate nucleotidyltransferase [Clostridiales bacterium]|nr:sugar phosphate nucleotidyltransferase [Clostridiales bacterium]
MGDGEAISLFVPGRLCLFGEHSDWAGLNRVLNADVPPGLALVTGVDQGIYADVRKSDRFIMRNTSDALKGNWTDFDAEMRPEGLKKIAESDNYFAYVAGVTLYVSEHYIVGGLEITITDMDLPQKGGLSSSAAICVLVTRAFNQLYGLNLNTIGEMRIAYSGERKTKSRCGRLDQACAFGKSPVVLTFDGEEIDVQRLIVKAPLFWVVARLIGRKDTIKILSDLNRCYPFPSTDVEYGVHDALGRANHGIVERAIALIRDGDAQGLGALMTEAQRLFDEKVAPASPEELAAPVLHRALADPVCLRLSYGGKGVGSQGDGSVQFLARSQHDQEELVAHLRSQGMEAYAFTIPERHRVRRAVIPVAGYGTRLYPMTRVIKKEFLPVFDTDGLVKPLILKLFEELADSGIEEICLIVGGAGEIEAYKKAFSAPLPDEHLSKLPQEMREYEKRVRSIGSRLVFAVQEQKLGFGHAVYQAREFCGGEPALMMLGDMMYRSGAKKPCALQLIEKYEEIEKPLIAVQQIDPGQAGSFGVLCGRWVDEAQRLMQAEKFIEKPSPEEAERGLSMPVEGGRRAVFGVFGQYILTPEVFSALGRIISESGSQAGSQGGEIQLTDAYAALIDGPGLYCAVPDGQMYDIGNVPAYKESVRAFV